MAADGTKHGGGARPTKKKATLDCCTPIQFSAGTQRQACSLGTLSPSLADMLRTHFLLLGTSLDTKRNMCIRFSQSRVFIHPFICIYMHILSTFDEHVKNEMTAITGIHVILKIKISIPNLALPRMGHTWVCYFLSLFSFLF